MVPARPRSTIITDDLLTLRRKEIGGNSARPHSAVLTDDFNLQPRKCIPESAIANQPHFTLVAGNSSEVSTRDSQSGEVLNQDNRNSNCSNETPYVASSQPTSAQQAEFTILQCKKQSPLTPVAVSAEQGEVSSAAQDLRIANSPQCIPDDKQAVISTGDKVTLLKVAAQLEK